MKRIVAVGLIGLVVAGCGLGTAPSTPDQPPPIVVEARDGEFVLRMSASKPRYAAGEPIQLVTQVVYLGPQDELGISHSGGGPIHVNLEQLDGPFDPGSASDAACARSIIKSGVPVEAAYQKTGAWSGDDPMKPQYQAFFGDPLVRLPAGTYRFSAMADFYVGDCGAGAAHGINASLTIAVEP
jgi:hypothetical protein